VFFTSHKFVSFVIRFQAIQLLNFFSQIQLDFFVIVPFLRKKLELFMLLATTFTIIVLEAIGCYFQVWTWDNT
jgi:hypothetical protein